MPERPLKGAWGITALLFFFMLINFADKVVVGLAAQPIMADLKLSPEQFGLLGSSFFFLFAISGVARSWSWRPSRNCHAGLRTGTGSRTARPPLTSRSRRRWFTNGI